jgi:hypothetical protein
VILFLDVPSRIDNTATTGAYYPFYDGIKHSSLSFQLATSIIGWNPFITHINMNGTNDCIAYINKLVYIGTNYSPGKLVISASAEGYGNTNYYFDDVGHPNTFGLGALEGVTNNGASLSQVTYAGGSVHITNGISAAGFLSWGVHGYNETNADYATNGSIVFNGNSAWWIIETIESFNGQRYRIGQGTFVKWYSRNAFGGTNYSSTPIGAVSHVNEPTTGGVNDSAKYFGLWQAEKTFAICAWNSRLTPYFQAVGDPFVTK